jgi:hypothetical protein
LKGSETKKTKDSVISNNSNQQTASETAESGRFDSAPVNILENFNNKKRQQVDELIKNNEKLMKMMEKQRKEIREGKEAEMRLKMVLEENQR